MGEQEFLNRVPPPLGLSSVSLGICAHRCALAVGCLEGSRVSLGICAHRCALAVDVIAHIAAVVESSPRIMCSTLGTLCCLCSPWNASNVHIHSAMSVHRDVHCFRQG